MALKAPIALYRPNVSIVSMLGVLKELTYRKTSAIISTGVGCPMSMLQHHETSSSTAVMESFDLG